MRIGFLEFGEIHPERNATQTITEVLARAQFAEDKQFSRFWIAEHNDPNTAWANSTTLLGVLACYTEKIKVGVAGVLLPLRSPLQVAQDYKLLANLFPNRIDLGIAKGVSSLTVSKYLLNEQEISANVKNHEERMQLVLQFLNDKHLEIGTQPLSGNTPQCWILTTGRTIEFIIENDLSSSFSLFHVPGTPINLVEDFRERFYKRNGKYPTFNIAIAATCCDDEHGVREIQNSFKSEYITPNIIATRSEFYDKVCQLQSDFQVEEIIIKDIAQTHERKLTSMGTISELFPQK